MILAPLETAAVTLGPKGNQTAPAHSAIAPNVLAGVSPLSGPFPALLQASQAGIQARPLDEPTGPGPGIDISTGTGDPSQADANGLGENAPPIFKSPSLLAPFASPGVLAQREVVPGKNPPPAGNLLPHKLPETPTLAVFEVVPAPELAPEMAQEPGQHLEAEDGPLLRVPPNARPITQSIAPAAALNDGASDPVIDRDVTHLPKIAAGPANPLKPAQPGMSDQPEVSRVTSKTVQDTSATGLATGSNPQPTAKPQPNNGPVAVPIKGGDRPEPRDKIPLTSPPAASVLQATDQHNPAHRPLAEPSPARPALAASILPAQTLPAQALPVKIAELAESKLTAATKAEKLAKPSLAPETSLPAARLPEQAVAARRLDSRRGGDAAEPARAAAAINDVTAGLQSASASSNAAPNTPPQSAQISTAAPAMPAPAEIRPETRPETRGAQPIESIVNQITEARETARSVRPELTLRHAEFGAVNVRLEASGGDLRATLASRDPGFVPAIQAALSERMIAATSESAATRGGDQSGQNGSSSQSPSQSFQGQFGGSGGFAEARYGSSPGSGQASSQPYSGQSEDSETNGEAGGRSLGGSDPAGAGVFA